MRIYADESCTKADQGDYMAIGAITCSKDTSKKIRQEINKLLNNNTKNFEFHFSQIKPNQVDIYKQLIDIFSKFYSKKNNYKCGINKLKIYREICFDLILIEHSKINHNLFNNGDAELGFFRFYYHLLHSTVSKYYISGKEFHITIDAIRTKNPKMVPNLHRRLFESVNSLSPNPVKTIQRQDSKAEPLLQMTDVILGCVSFKWNRERKISQNTELSLKNQARREVYSYLEKKIKIDLLEETIPGRSFNIWKIKLQ